MATKTKAPAKKPAKKTDTVLYKGKEYEVLERNDHKVKITDGMIHFWVKAEDVAAD